MDALSASACVFESPAFAWNHGDVQPDITTTWFGMAGPGVSSAGRNDSVFSDHTDLRPTVLALVGLTDDYVSDGRVLVEFVAPELVPDRHQYVNLAQVYKQINAPLGKVGLASLTYANRSITSVTSNDATYNDYLNKIGGIASTRNNLAAHDLAVNGAAFSRKQFSRKSKRSDFSRQSTVSTVQGLAGP